MSDGDDDRPEMEPEARVLTREELQQFSFENPTFGYGHGFQDSYTRRHGNDASSYAVNFGGGFPSSNPVSSQVGGLASSNHTTYRLPGYNTSSYMPSLDANITKNFSCCGLNLPTLHALSLHYEETHSETDSRPGTTHEVQHDHDATDGSGKNEDSDPDVEPFQSFERGLRTRDGRDSVIAATSPKPSEGSGGSDTTGIDNMSVQDGLPPASSEQEDDAWSHDNAPTTQQRLDQLKTYAANIAPSTPGPSF